MHSEVEKRGRVVIEVTNSHGFADSAYTRRGYFLAVANADAYDGGGFQRHKGLWIVMADCESGALFSEPIGRCREVHPAALAEQPQ